MKEVTRKYVAVVVVSLCFLMTASTVGITQTNGHFKLGPARWLAFDLTGGHFEIEYFSLLLFLATALSCMVLSWMVVTVIPAATDRLRRRHSNNGR